ncbi:MAG: alpha/beta hydrolase [Chloroflexi bacterium]|nr:alpha/beta hydrolase [Chloroflexota bacterium]
MRPTAIGFKSKRLMLEGIVTTPEGVPTPYPAVVVCHPHPALGGNMGHPVVAAICQAADAEGMATLRFNFRGVGESEGSFTNGKDEQQDIKSALDVFRRWPGVDGKRIALAGYSFGAAVILNGIRHYKPAKALALIAPPISSIEGAKSRQDNQPSILPAINNLRNLRFLRIKNPSLDRRPMLFIVGQNDRIAPSVDVQRAIDKLQSPAQFREIASADHSLRGHEKSVASEVARFLKETLAG